MAACGQAHLPAGTLLTIIRISIPLYEKML
jgi:hypothetical protein